jgi:hypothetical protein
VWKKWPKYGTKYHLKNPKVNKRPMGENSPNPVALVIA